MSIEDVLSQSRGYAEAVDAAGNVVGRGRGMDSSLEPLHWDVDGEPGSMTLPPGATRAHFYASNRYGDTVGFVELSIGTKVAALWSKNREGGVEPATLDLNALSGGTLGLSFAYDINDAGQIAARQTTVAPYGWYLLTPKTTP